MVGKALAAWRSELLDDLGGAASISTQEAALLDAAVKTKLILDSVDAWLLSQKSLINKRSRSVIAAVQQRNSLVATLKGLLESLGLQRRAKRIPTLTEWLASPPSEQKDSGGETAPTEDHQNAAEEEVPGLEQAKDTEPGR
jgi:hypothetical protein